MIHPFLKKLATDPGLFMEHASAYAVLATLEVKDAGLTWRRKAVALSACVTLSMLALALSALALMLVAVIPVASMPAPWVLAGVPGALWLVCAVLWWLGSRKPQAQPFTHLRQQWAADARLIREVSEAA